VSPDIDTTQDDSLLFFATQLYPVIRVVASLQLSTAVAANAVGAFGGVMVVGLLQEMIGPTVS
jgi:hypothetical protein